MSDVNLLCFGCVVTFISVAGAYVYIREAFTAEEEQPREPEARSAEAVEPEVPDAA